MADEMELLRSKVLKTWEEAIENEELPLHYRVRVARDMAPYLFPKHAVVTQVNGNDLAERLMRAIVESNKVVSSQSRQVIEPPKPED